MAINEPCMDENGEFIHHNWMSRRALRSLATNKVVYDKDLKRYTSPSPARELVSVYIVSIRGKEEIVCRDRLYASYLLGKLLDGCWASDVCCERIWLLREARRLRMTFRPGASCPYLFLSSHGLICKRFMHEIDALAWGEWYAERTRIMNTREPSKSAHVQYISFRMKETLDKPMDVRVCEIRKSLISEELPGDYQQGESRGKGPTDSDEVYRPQRGKAV